MARKIDIHDFDPDLSSLDGFIRSLNDAAPYLTDFSIGKITLGRLRRLHVLPEYLLSLSSPMKSLDDMDPAFQY